VKTRRRCATPTWRHAPHAHQEGGACRLCSCTRWLNRKRHTWREQVTDAWLLATETWLRHREEVCNGWTTEEAEFEEHHPRPRLADFMDALRPGIAPEVLEQLSVPCRCCGRRQQVAS
jgi:hypothetical protein